MRCSGRSRSSGTCAGGHDRNELRGHGSSIVAGLPDQSAPRQATPRPPGPLYAPTTGPIRPMIAVTFGRGGASRCLKVQHRLARRGSMEHGEAAQRRAAADLLDDHVDDPLSGCAASRVGRPRRHARDQRFDVEQAADERLRAADPAAAVEVGQGVEQDQDRDLASPLRRLLGDGGCGVARLDVVERRAHEELQPTAHALGVDEVDSSRVEVLRRECRRLQRAAQLGGDVQPDDLSSGLASNVLVQRREGVRRRLRRRRVHVGALRASRRTDRRRCPLRRGIARRRNGRSAARRGRLAPAHPTARCRTVLSVTRWITSTRARARTGSAPVPRPAARTRSRDAFARRLAHQRVGVILAPTSSPR